MAKIEDAYADGETLTEAKLDTAFERAVPIGTILPWAKSRSNTPPLPENFAECNGQTIDDAESPYDGQTLPDLNGNNRFLRGNSTSGGTGGEDSVQLSVSEMPSHNHTIKWRNTYLDTGDWMITGTSQTTDRTNGSSDISVRPSGGDEAHENRPPFFDVVMVMRIK